MSRFWGAAGDSDSESSEASSDDETKTTRPQPSRVRPVLFLSDDEDDEKRVVRSLKDKRFDELKDIIRSLKNSEKIRDVAKVQTAFETLQKAYIKSKSVVNQEGGTPKFYIKALSEMEDFVQKLWDDKEAKQKLSKINAKALASLKQKVRKYNKDFESSIAHCRENPAVYEEEEEEVEAVVKDEKSEEEEEVVEVKKPKAPQVEPKASQDKADGGSESDDSMDWDMSESDSSSEDEVGGGQEPGEYHYTAEYFLKKTDKEQKDVKKKREPKIKRVKIEADGDADADEDEGWEVVPHRSAIHRVLTEKDKMRIIFGKEKVEMEMIVIAKKRDQMVEGKGKKGTDRFDQVKLLQYLLDISNSAALGLGPAFRLHVDIVEAVFEIPSAAAAMKSETWEQCLKYLGELLELLIANPDFILSPSVRDDDENFTDPDRSYMLKGSLVGFIERMDDEFTKVLQATDAHSTEYVTRLRDEGKVTGIIARTQQYLEGRQGSNRNADLCHIYMRTMEHLYYKVDRKQYGNGTGAEDGKKEEEKKGEKEDEEKKDEVKKVEEKAEEDESSREEKVDSSAVMSSLSKFIYSHDDEYSPMKTRAILCHIYYHAIHDRWFQARDLMMMSHLQEGIQHADVPTQILYNRALVQLGMCAFRHGMIKEAHDVLMDIHSPTRPKDSKELAKELLAQGISPRHDRTPEQEKIDRRRQVPFHMHINLELMECVYLTSAMLFEIPYMAATERAGRRRMISKGFYHQLKNHEKQPLVAPPETMREHVVAAANAMKAGEWKKCCDFVLAIKAWNLFINVEQVKQMLSNKIQEESLRTYIFSYGYVYDTLSLVRLSDMFSLPLSMIHSIVSKMIIKEELLASLDEPTKTIQMHHTKPSKLQSLALHLAEKLTVVADYTEELMKVKQGPSAPWSASAGGSGKQQGQKQQHGHGQKQHYGQQQYGQQQAWGARGGRRRGPRVQ